MANPTTVPLARVRNIGIIAHIDAGKTTVTERILFYTGKEHRLGEVHEGTAKMDWMPEEQERGITADRYRVPRLAFINKLDRPGAVFDKAVESLRKKLHANAIPVQVPIGTEADFRGVVDLVSRRLLTWEHDSLGAKVVSAEIPPELADEFEMQRDHLVESVTEISEALAEKFLAEQPISDDDLRAGIRAATIAGRMFPVFAGAAFKNKGVQPLLDGVIDYLPSPLDRGEVRGLHPKHEKEVARQPDPKEPFAGLAFKIFYEAHADLTFVRIYSGTLRTGDQVYIPRLKRPERIGRIFRMHANERQTIDEAQAGDIIAVPGLKLTVTGDTLCDPAHPIALESMTFPEPVISMAIEPKTLADRDKLLESLKRLEREDPTFTQRVDDETGQLIVSGMGELHLEVLKNRMLREFRVDANVGTPRVAYRQTIRESVEGEARVERQMAGRVHFGHVVLRLEPARTKTHAIEVESQLPPEAIPKAFIPSILETVRSAGLGGHTLGYPIIDVRAILIGGSFHQVDSSEIAYQQAADMAFSNALDKRGTVVLEPIMRFEIESPAEHLSGIIGDLNSRRARIGDMDSQSSPAVIRGTVPLGEMFEYATTLRSLSRGSATYTMEPADFAPVPEDVRRRLEGE
ncbi:MAG: elongation factor G [Planctomycetes bacterium]|nr:elongation factor G [Planctomycetota bacterium]